VDRVVILEVPLGGFLSCCKGGRRWDPFVEMLPANLGAENVIVDRKKANYIHDLHDNILTACINANNIDT
jgi:hypothetical protein